MPIVKNLPFHEYRAIPAVNDSYLGRLDVCPAAARLPDIEDNDTLLFGRALHAYALEGEEGLARDFVVIPAGDGRTKAVKEERARLQTENLDKSLLKQDDFDTIKAMRAAVLNHPFASKIMRVGGAEVTVTWTDEETGIYCKSRIDWLPDDSRGVVVDLKGLKSAASSAVERATINYGFARKAAMYLDGYAKESGKKFDLFAFIVVEKLPPYRTEVYTLSQDMIEYGFQEYHRLLRVEQQCRAAYADTIDVLKQTQKEITPEHLAWAEQQAWPNYQHAGADEIYRPAWLK